MSKNLSKSDLIISLAGELNVSEQVAKSTLNHIVTKILESLAAYGEVTLTGFGAPITVKQKPKTEFSADDVKAEQRISVMQKESKPGYEQRKLDRRNFILDIEVTHQTTNQVLGSLGDITAAGIMLVSDEPISEDTLFPVKLSLPEEADEELVIVFNATSIRCQQTIHENIYFTGFKIENLDEENQQKIEHFISEYAV